MGIGFDALRRVVPVRESRLAAAWSHLITIATAAILVAYGMRLHAVISDWTRRAAVSERAVVELERQVSGAPADALVLIGTPPLSWEWAMPFAARPPYTRTDLTTRAFIVVPRVLHCCRGHQWETETRNALRRWQRQPDASIVALFVNDAGEVRRLTSSDDPDLAILVRTLRGTGSGDDLDGAIVDILRKLVAGRGPVVRPGRRE
jgi:hypothetical protein